MPLKFSKASLLMIVAVLVMIVPVICVSLYSMPAADDFNNAMVVRDRLTAHGNSYLVAAAVGTADLYQSTGGYYFALFMNYIFSPFIRAGVTGIRVFNAVANVFFFVSLFLFVKAAMSMFANKKNLVLTLAVFTALVFSLINNYLNHEIYSWYVVIVGYITPLSVALLALGCYIKALVSDKKGWVVGAALLGFLASGSSLNILVLFCGISVLLLFIGIRKYGKTKQAALIIVFILVGAIINIAAPGNFARHDMITTDYNLLQALALTVKQVLSRALYLATQTPFPIIAVVLGLVLYTHVPDEPKWDCRGFHLVISALIFFVGIVLIDLTVYLGYSTGYFPDRAVFVQDLAIYILSFVWLCQLAFWAKRRRPSAKLPRAFVATVAVACALLCCVLFVHKPLSTWTTPFMIESVADGSLAEFADYEQGILDEIEQSPDADVVVQRPAKDNRLIYGIHLTEDKNNWVNVAVAHFYLKASVALVSP